MEEAERRFRHLARVLYGYDDAIEHPDNEPGEEPHLRTIEVTPFDGAYGLAGWVLAINGSPPKGIFVVRRDTYGLLTPVVVYIGLLGKSRRLQDRYATIVKEYLDWRKHLADPR